MLCYCILLLHLSDCQSYFLKLRLHIKTFKLKLLAAPCKYYIRIWVLLAGPTCRIATAMETYMHKDFYFCFYYDFKYFLTGYIHFWKLGEKFEQLQYNHKQINSKARYLKPLQTNKNISNGQLEIE